MESAEAVRCSAMNVEKGMRLDGVFDMESPDERRSSDGVVKAVISRSDEAEEDDAIWRTTS